MKEEMALQEKLELQATINDLNFQIQRLDTQLREVARVTADLGKRLAEMCFSSGQWTINHIHPLQNRNHLGTSYIVEQRERQKTQ